MALITYHACDRCGEKRDKPHNNVDLLLTSKTPDKSMTVVVPTLAFGGSVVRKTVELCDACSGKLAEATEKFMKV
jgi:hypothetical protein